MLTLEEFKTKNKEYRKADKEKDELIRVSKIEQLTKIFDNINNNILRELEENVNKTLKLQVVYKDLLNIEDLVTRQYYQENGFIAFCNKFIIGYLNNISNIEVEVEYKTDPEDKISKMLSMTINMEQFK